MLMKSIVTENARTRQVAKPNHGNACCNQFTDKKRMMRTEGALEDSDVGHSGLSIVIPSLIGESSLFRSAYWIGSSEVEKKAYILRLLRIALESDNDL
jgi:hypothetical protein